jgi:hypothetical protein
MNLVKFLILSLLAFGLKVVDGKVFNCAALTSIPNGCSFDSQVLGINDTASFTVSSGLTPANIQYIYFNSYVAKSMSSYYIPASLFIFFPNAFYIYFVYGNIQEIRSNTFLNATKLWKFFT